MKRIVIFLACAVAGILISIGAAQAQERVADPNVKNRKKSPIEFTFGFNCHYLWWEPVWTKSRAATFYSFVTIVFRDMNIEKAGNFAYNPVFSLRFADRWSITGSFLYGYFKVDGKAYGVQTASSVPFRWDKTLKIRKYDAELLANYDIIDWLKIYAGPKYQGYSIHDEDIIINMIPAAGVAFQYKDNVRFHSFGGGAGVTFLAPIYKGLYFIPAVSGIFLFGKDYTNGGLLVEPQKSFLIGGIGSGMFAYFNKKIHLTVSAGFKAQYLYYQKTPRREHRKDFDLVYGPFLSLLFTF